MESTQLIFFSVAALALYSVVRASKQKAKAQASSSSDAPVCCPKCWSTQFSSDRKGYGWVKGLTLGVATGGLGLLGGFHGSRKVLLTCLKCGHQWRAGSI